MLNRQLNILILHFGDLNNISAFIIIVCQSIYLERFLSKKPDKIFFTLEFVPTAEKVTITVRFLVASQQEGFIDILPSSVFIANAIGTILMIHVRALPTKLLKCLVLPILTKRYKRRQEITQ